ncbi:DUF357 domain-containing protein [Candidatus Bathyarchaeota archaeon]|nr:DUF357 domain-containing protein [Candidatus Bathyarchaeota archaeon]
MSLEKLVAKYMHSAEHALRELEIADKSIMVNAEDLQRVVTLAKDYFKDAEYYREKGELAVSLTSIAYCEGLLDALRLLGGVRFEWPTNR